jgi:hypothetical protein
VVSLLPGSDWTVARLIEEVQSKLSIECSLILCSVRVNKIVKRLKPSEKLEDLELGSMNMMAFEVASLDENHVSIELGWAQLTRFSKNKPL